MLRDRTAGDFGAALHAATVVIGDKLGLYRALAEIGPADAAALAAATGCDTRLVEEWLDAQYVSGYCQYSAQTGTYWLTPEQAAVLADPTSPAFLVGAMTIAASIAKDEEKVREAFTTGAGLGWHEHHHDLFHGTERLFKPGYVANLVARGSRRSTASTSGSGRGGTVADLGCGHGASTILLAQAYPNATDRRLRLPPGVDRRRPQARRRGRRRRPRALRGRVRPGLPRRRATTSCASSMRCTTWATRPARPPHPRAPSTPTARGCWSSRWPAKPRGRA